MTRLIEEVILARGHKNISARHGSTLEITKDNELSKSGDCVIGVSADRALTDLTEEFRKNLIRIDARLTVLIEAGGETEIVHAQGCPNLILSDPRDLVIRKSNYICNRTLAIRSDKAAFNLSRALVKELKNPKRTVEISLKIESTYFCVEDDLPFKRSSFSNLSRK